MAEGFRKINKEKLEEIIVFFEENLDNNKAILNYDFFNGIPSCIFKEIALEYNIDHVTLLKYLRSCNYLLKGTHNKKKSLYIHYHS